MDGTINTLFGVLLVMAVIALLVYLVVMMVDKKMSWSDLGLKDNMVGAHWNQKGGYGHNTMTLPAFGYSGYHQSVPTPSYA